MERSGTECLICRPIEHALQVVQVSFEAQWQATFQESRAQPLGNASKADVTPKCLGRASLLPTQSPPRVAGTWSEFDLITACASLYPPQSTSVSSHPQPTNSLSSLLFSPPPSSPSSVIITSLLYLRLHLQPQPQPQPHHPPPTSHFSSSLLASPHILFPYTFPISKIQSLHGLAVHSFEDCLYLYRRMLDF